MNLKVKKLNKEATLPTYATDGSNGLDLTSVGHIIMPSYVEVRTGIAVEIPEGYVGLLLPRSSITNKNLMLANSVGVIDSDYRGEVLLRFKVLEESAAGLHKYSNLYNAGEKVGQLLLVQVPKLKVEEVTQLGTTVRNAGGFGSTDKK